MVDTVLPGDDEPFVSPKPHDDEFSPDNMPEDPPTEDPPSEPVQDPPSTPPDQPEPPQ
jgi:hypothetical protein